MKVPEPQRALNLFRLGLDTMDIAVRLGVPETVAARLLEAGRDIEWFARQREHEWRKAHG